MKEKKDHLLYIVLIIMGLVAISSIVFATLVGSLYVKEKETMVDINENQTYTNSKTDSDNMLMDSPDLYTQEQVDILLQEKEEQTQNSMKKKIIELLQASGSSLYMLRNIFQDRLVFTDDGNFYFIEILDSIKKHNFDNNNFVKDERNLLTYKDNENVISHKGIDVSKYQGDIDWEKVYADGVEFAIIRLGVRGYESGKIVLDDYFEKNMKEANDAGILTGVYFFTQAISEEEAIEEAEFVISNLENYDVTCPIVFDVEKIEGAKGRMNKLSQEERTNVTIAFCEKIKSAGYTPMIYGNIKCFGKLLDITRLEEYEKWFAFYDDYLYYPYEVDMWQYSESGKVNGIKGNVDMNISFHLW